MSTTDQTLAPDPVAHRLVRSTLALVVGAGILFAAAVVGFVDFLDRVERTKPLANVRADAIVALTGGADRITDAIAMLAEGKARRLLITGVNTHTHEADLVRQTGHKPLYDCCVDLDRRALNTVGNAVETGAWLRKHGFRSVIVVTSSYHMPRALVELERHVGGVSFIPHPVTVESARPARLWREPLVLRLLVTEYAKLLFSEARRLIMPGTGTSKT